MATVWLSANEIDACNDDLAVAITKIIKGKKISTKNHLILPVELFGLT